jgi:TRAP-type uncharacterized transport system substrate-binding protein
MKFYTETPSGIRGLNRFLSVVLMAFACVYPIDRSAAVDVRPNYARKSMVELETNGAGGISVRIAEDLASLYDDGATRRLLPVVGKDATQNLRDLIQLRGIDMAILQVDVLETERRQRSWPAVERGFTYITQLYNEEFHLLVGPDVKTIADLAHRRVNFDTLGSGTNVTASRVFSLLDISVEPTFDRQDLALERLRQGKVAAVAFVAAKPAPLFLAVRRDEGLHFLAIPLREAVISAYVPAKLNSDDYPELIAPEHPIETVAVGSLLAAAVLPPKSDRYRDVSDFVDVLFTQFPALLEAGHHPKWREINLAATIPGWTRFPPAQQWLDRNTTAPRQQPQDVANLFSKFLDSRQQALSGAPITEQQKQELFNQFQRWQAGQAR